MAKHEFALKKLAYTVPLLTNRKIVFSDVLQLYACLGTLLNFEPISSPVIYLIYMSVVYALGSALEMSAV